MSQMSSGTGDPSVQPSDNQGVRRLQAHENESDDLRLIEFFLPVTELNDIAAAEKKHPEASRGADSLLAGAAADHRVPGRHLRRPGSRAEGEEGADRSRRLRAKARR